MQRLVDNFDTPAYVVRADPELTIVAFNRHIEQALRVAKFEAVGRPAYDRLRPHIQPPARDRRVADLRRRDWWEGHTDLADRDGQPVPFTGICRPVLYDGAKHYMTVLFLLGVAGSDATREQRSLVGVATTCNRSNEMIEDAKQAREDAKQARRKRVAYNLRRLRTPTGLSQAKAAAKIGVQREHLNRWENAQWEPNAANIARLAHLFGVDESEFYRTPAD
jgi:DNA-binding XRE family transcriptional regulator